VTQAAPPRQTVRIQAVRTVEKRLGDWTTARQFDVRAASGAVVLDLLLPRLEVGDIEIRVDLNRAMLKLLVADGVVIDDSDLRYVGRGRIKDWTGVADKDGRRIRLVGELRSSEIRVHRGGIAIVSLVAAGLGRAVRAAHRDGRLGEGQQ
jgi:hypothetical protein